jgi:hypothetical protein
MLMVTAQYWLSVLFYPHSGVSIRVGKKRWAARARGQVISAPRLACTADTPFIFRHRYEYKVGT